MTDQETRTFTRTDCLLLGILLALVLPLRFWLLYNTEVTARDSIGYIRYALQFERMPWQEVWEKNHQHPGYPMSVYLVSLAVRAIDGETTPQNMALSTQLVNLFASILLMLPMYLLGRQFFDHTVSFGGTLLYQYLPVSAHHLSDGISEPIYLVLLVSGLLQMVLAMRDRRIRNCIYCGFFTGIAYLVRPEGLLVVPAFGLALFVVQCSRQWRSTGGRFFACGTTMLLTAMLVGSIYVYATGRITNKLSAIETMKKVWEPVSALFAASSNGMTNSHLFAVSFSPSDSNAIRAQQSVGAYAKEICQGFHYVAIVPALLGLWWSLASLRRQAAFWALAIYGMLHSLILIALAMSVFYVSDRHVMILVLSGSFFVVIGLRELPRRVLEWSTRPGTVSPCPTFTAEPSSEEKRAWYRSAKVWFVILFVALVGFCLPRATQRLHGTRVGNHQAGLWLAEHVNPADVVEDDHAWSNYFSGLVFQEGCEPALPRDHQSTCYVVTTRSRDPVIDSQRRSAKLSDKAEVVYVWPTDATAENARVIVHAQPRSFEANPWRIASP